MIRLLGRFFGMYDHEQVRRELDKHEKALQKHERRLGELEHLRLEQSLYKNHKTTGAT